MGDQAFAIECGVDAQRRGDVEMHLVGVEQSDAARLPQHPLHGIVGERGFELGQDFKRRHAAKAAAELRDDVEIILVVGATRRNCRINRHGALRVEVLDLVAEGGRGLEMAPHRLVTRLRLVMERGRQLNAERDLGEDTVERVVERIEAGRRKLDVHIDLRAGWAASVHLATARAVFGMI